MEDELFEDMIFYIENPSEEGDKYSKLILAQLVKRREYKVNTKKICLYLIQNSKIL